MNRLRYSARFRRWTPKNLVRGGFKGYKTEKEVPPDSAVETFAALRVEIQSWRWSGVPFLIRAGKSIPVTTPKCLSNLENLRSTIWRTNRPTIFRLGPGEISISLSANVKRPGEELVYKSTHLSVVEDHTADEVDAYERLLGDAMRGDALLFVREGAVEVAWAIVDPILGNTTPLAEYEPGSWGPHEAIRLADDVGGWHDPEGSEADKVAGPRAA